MDYDIYSLQALYSLCGVLITALYIPQLMTTIKAKSALQEISLVTWGLWTVCLAVSVFYALLETKDLKFALVSLGGCLFCGLITLVTLYKRHKYRNVSKSLSLLIHSPE